MSDIPEELSYTKEDEWVKVEGDEVIVGITDYAQDSLSDIVYLELPDVGDEFEKGDVFGVVESVKAAADLFMPVAGEVTEVNNVLADTPEIANTDPYGEGWMIRLKLTNPEQLDDLMDAESYSEYCDERA
jgi:glycine cleavage system H protein